MELKELFYEISQRYKNVVDINNEETKSKALRKLEEDLKTTQSHIEASIRTIETIDPIRTNSLKESLLKPIKIEREQLESNSKNYITNFEVQELAERTALNYLSLIKQYDSMENNDFYDLLYKFKSNNKEKHNELTELNEQITSYDFVMNFGDVDKMNLKIVYSDHQEMFILTTSANYINFEESLRSLMKNKNEISKEVEFIAVSLNGYPENPVETMARILKIKKALNQDTQNIFAEIGITSAMVGAKNKELKRPSSEADIIDAISLTFENACAFGAKDTIINGLKTTNFGYSGADIKEYGLNAIGGRKLLNMADEVKISTILNQESPKQKKRLSQKP